MFDGRYITGDIDAGYLTDLQATRNDLAKSQREQKPSTTHADASPMNA